MLASVANISSGNQSGRGVRKREPIGVAPNVVDITNLQRSTETGDVYISWSLEFPAPVLISWSYTDASSSVTSPYFVRAGNYSAILPSFINFILSHIVFTITVTNSKGTVYSDYSASETLVVPGIVSDLTVLNETIIRSFALSKSTGQYIIAANENGVFVSTDFGNAFSLRSSFSPFGNANNLAYISDNGQTVVLYPSTPATVSNSSIYVSLTGGNDFFAVNISSSNFSLTGMSFSTGAEYIFASGSGTNGGLYRSTNRGTSFTRMVAEVNAAGCTCSANGRTVIVAVPQGSSWISYDYGVTFYNFGPTSYPAKRPYLHPKENYVAIRSVDEATQGFLFTNVNLDDAQIAGTIEYATGTQLSGVPGDLESCGAIDINGMFYFVDLSMNRLRCFSSSDFSADSLQTVYRLQDVSYTDARIQVTIGNGQYILGLNQGKLRLAKQYSESNTVTFSASPSISENGSAFLSWSFSLARPALISWTPTTLNTAQPVKVVSSNTRSYSFTASAFLPYVEYTFTVSSLDMTGKLITAEATYPTTVQYAPAIRNVTAISGSTCYSLAVSSQGKYVFVMTNSGTWFSSNYGYSFDRKTTVSNNPYTNNVSVSFVSNDGAYVYLTRSGSNTGNVFYYSLNGGSTFSSKTLPNTGVNIYSMCCSVEGKYVFFTANGTNGGIYSYQNFITATSTGTRKKAISHSYLKNAACSAEGRIIIVAVQGYAPYVSYDYGSTFSEFASSPIYQNVRTYVHPDGTYYSLRSWTPDAFMYSNLETPNGNITEDAAMYTGTNANVALLSPDIADRTFNERNGRIYFINSSDNNYLYYMNLFTTEITKVPTVVDTLSDPRIVGSLNGRFLANCSGGKFYLINFWNELNEVQNLTATFTNDVNNLQAGYTVQLRWRPRRTDRKTSVRWTNTAFNINQTSGYTSIKYSETITTLGATTYSVTGINPRNTNSFSYVFTVSTLDGSGTFITSFGTTVVTVPGWPVITPTFTNTANVITGTIGTMYATYELKGATDFTVNNSGPVELIVVGGGGGGGLSGGSTSPGGGGGGGEVVTGRYFLYTGINYTVTIGNGGSYQGNGSNTQLSVKNGSNLVVALGGGRGDTASSNANVRRSSSGGSSGGSARRHTNTDFVNAVGVNGVSLNRVLDAELVRLVGTGSASSQNEAGNGGGASGTSKEGYKWPIDGVTYGSGGGGGSSITGATVPGGANGGTGGRSSGITGGVANRGGGGGGSNSTFCGGGGSGVVKFAVFA